MSDPIQSALVVLSDLHFGADFLLEAEVDPVQVPFLLKHLAPKIRRFFETSCKSHDMAIVINLPKYLKKVLRQLSREQFDRSKFDFLVLLGDLATYANGGTYSFLGQYLTQDIYQYAPRKQISGLRSIYENEVIAVPGNHDKLLRKNLDFYHATFCRNIGLAAEPKPQRTYCISHTVRNMEFLFVLIEASKYAAVDGKLDFSALYHLAGGEITKELRNDLKRKLGEIKSGHQVDKAKLNDYGTARKILLVHYAVDDRVVLGLTPNAQELVVSHRCEGLDDLIKELRSSIDLVLHGHLHCPRIYNHHGAQVLSATTTTQRNGTNGFFVLKFMLSGDIIVDYHKWNEHGFMKDDTAELNVRISRTPPQNSNTQKSLSNQASS